MFAVEASAEGSIDGLRWTLKLTAEVTAKTLETLTQKLVEEVEAGHEEDAGMIVKTTTIEGVGRLVEVGGGVDILMSNFYERPYPSVSRLRFQNGVIFRLSVSSAIDIFVCLN